MTSRDTHLCLFELSYVRVRVVRPALVCKKIKYRLLKPGIKSTPNPLDPPVGYTAHSLSNQLNSNIKVYLME